MVRSRRLERAASPRPSSTTWNRRLGRDPVTPARATRSMNAAPLLLLAAAEPPVGDGVTLAPWAGLLLGLLLVLLNGFFVAAEFALVKLRPTQLESEGESGLRLRLVQHMLAHL